MLDFLRDEDGQGMVEYGLIIGLVAVVAIVALIAIGGKVKGIFEDTNNALQKATTV